jgi:hypothetical protein
MNNKYLSEFMKIYGNVEPLSENWIPKLYKRAEAHIKDGNFKMADQDYNSIYEEESINDADNGSHYSKYHVRTRQSETYKKHGQLHHAAIWNVEVLDLQFEIEKEYETPSSQKHEAEFEELEWDKKLPDKHSLSAEEFIERKMKNVFINSKKLFIQVHLNEYISGAKGYYYLNEFDNASKLFHRILKADKSNNEIKNWIKRIEDIQ